MVIYAKRTQGVPAVLDVSPTILELIFEKSPEHREWALGYHRRLQAQAKILAEKVLAGELQCEHIRQNGKQCLNRNQPGYFYCGLHKPKEDEQA